MVHNLRLQNAQKTSHTEKVKTHDETDHMDCTWMAAETLDKEQGSHKGKLWRGSGKLACRPCSPTGSTEELMRE